MLEVALRSAAFTFLALVGPGVALQRLLRLPIDPALVLALGGAATAAACWAGLALGVSWLLPVACVAFAASLALPLGRWRLAPGPGLRGALAPAAAFALFASLTAWPWNRPGAAGEFVLDPLVPYDTCFHAGLARELSHTYPPQVPGLSGFRLGYHLGADLLRAGALRVFGLDPYDALTRLDPLLGALALILLLRCVTQRLGAPPLAVTLSAWTLLATDFSFAFAGNPQAHWWTDLLRGNLLISLDLANPVVPALGLALGSLVALDRHLKGEGPGWLALGVVLAAAVPFFKVFLGAHLLLGLGVAALRAGGRERRALAALALPAAAATAALALGQGGASLEVALDPFDLVRTTRQAIGLPPATGGAFVAWCAFWVAASLGVRAIGVLPALRALAGGPLASAVAAMALSGWPLGLLFRVSAPQALPDQKLVNDAAFLVEQSGPLLWIFAAIALVRVAPRGLRAAIAIAISAGLALPATAQFVVQKRSWPNLALPAPMVRAMRALEAASRPGDVVLQRPSARFPPAPVVLIGRRVPYDRFTPWLTQFASSEALVARHEQVYRFFRTQDRDEAVALARGLDARFVCLYGGDRVRFETPGLLEPIHEEPDARCYRLRLP